MDEKYKGEILNSYKYDAFGNTTSYTEKVANRFRHAGEQFDKITGQYYLRARYYNPEIGRFTQEDAYRGDGLNLYAYVGNNPVRYVDPWGYSKCEGSSKKTIDECIIDVAEFLDPGIVERTNRRFDSEEDFLNYVTAGFSGKIAKQYRAKPFSKEYWQAFSDALQDVVTVGVPAYKEYITAKKGIVDVSTKTVSSSKKSWIKNTWNKVKNKAKKILSKDKSVSTTNGSVDIQLFGNGKSKGKIFFGQKGVSPNFSKGGKFKGASIELVTEKLKMGILSPDDLPIEYVIRDGKMITLNNRSLTALSKAGLEPTKLINKTGNQFFEKQITERLAEMRGQPSTSIFIRKIKETIQLP